MEYRRHCPIHEMQVVTTIEDSHSAIEDWMHEEALVLVRQNGELTFMWTYDAEHLNKENIREHSVDFLSKIIEKL